MPPQLVVIGGPLRDRIFPLEEGRTLTLGRLAQSDIRLEDQYVSRRHGQIQVERGRVVLWDLGSFNGTWVNGRRLTDAASPCELRLGDQVRLGETRLRLQPGEIALEPEWLASTDPDLMLRFLRGRASDRKLRLFACACLRNIDYLTTDMRSQTLLTLGERHADGLATAEELELADTSVASWPHPFSAPAWPVVVSNAMEAARRSAAMALRLLELQEAEEQRLGPCHLLREVFNPFSCSPIDPYWLQWNEGCVVRLARSIYEEGRFDDLPVLADALEDAGCTDEVLLSHCRDGQQHVRGCWVLDAVLGKE